MTAARVWRTATATTLVVLLAVAVPAGANSRCLEPSRDPLAPRLTFPCDGARIRAGNNFVWRVHDADPAARRRPYHPYLNVTRRRPRHGHLPRDNSGYGIYAQMHRLRGRRASFRYQAPSRQLPGYWLFRKGVWYVQVSQVDPAGRGSIRYGPVERIVIR